MFGISIQTISFWLVAGLTWIVIMLGVIQLSRFFTKFQEVRRDIEGNMLGIAGQIKQMQGTLTELLGEQRRVTRLLLEQLELKRAEMTGEFDIVEEPVNANTKPVVAAESPKEGQSDEKLAPPPNKFPKL